MLASRKLTAVFIATFLIGAAAGALIAVDFTDTQVSDFMRHTSDADSLAARIDQKYLADYQLSADEETRIRPITREMAQHLFSIRHQFGVDVISTMEAYHARIAEQMTAAHREAYARANDERRKRMTAMLLPDQTAAAASAR